MIPVIFWMTVVVGAYMAWNIGANDVANAMGTSVGSGALTFRQAVVLAGIFELAGAMLVGSHVTDTVRKGIVDPALFVGDPELFAIGMFSALFGAAIWLHLASYLGLPVSTTHSIVGAIAGFGLIFGGFGAVKWGAMGWITLSWIVSPFVGGIIAFMTFKVIQRKIFDSSSPGRAAYNLAPYFTFVVGVTLVLSIIYKGLKNLHLDLPLSTAVVYASAAGIVIAVIYRLLLRGSWSRCEVGSTTQENAFVENIFGYLQIATACCVAFAHGANDVANAVGPLAAVYIIFKENVVTATVAVPSWILGIGAIGIVIGLGTWGYRVMGTIGTKITEITPTRGFSAEFGTATTVLLCSRMGLPVSTTQVLVGAVIGVGLARGIGALDTSVIRRVVASWAFGIPFTAALCVAIYMITCSIAIIM